MTVYYDPADPGNAVLDRGAGQITPCIWLEGGLTLLGLLSLAAALRSRMVKG